MTRPTLAAASWIRRHGDRAAAGASVRGRSCYGAGNGELAGLAPRRDTGSARGLSMTPHAQAIGDALRRRAPVADAELDQVFPEELRERSAMHWTPVAVAIRAAELLAPSPEARVLDVGAGVGKLCLIGALVTGATWWGVEQDAVQVAAASQAAWALDVTGRTRFVHGDGSRLAWDEFDALYFYNPFATLMLAPHASPFLRYATIQRTLQRIEQRLAVARPGTRVVTFHGFGGRLPAGFTRIAREPAADDALELWVRDAPGLGARGA